MKACAAKTPIYSSIAQQYQDYPTRLKFPALSDTPVLLLNQHKENNTQHLSIPSMIAWMDSEYRLQKLVFKAGVGMRTIAVNLLWW